MFDRPFTFDRVVRIVFSIAIVGGIIFLIALLRNALLPFLIAWLLAYMMQPFVKFFQYKLKFRSRILSIVAVIISTILVCTMLYFLVIPSVTQEVNRTMELIQEPNQNYERIPMIPQSWIHFIEKNIDPDELYKLLSKENIENAIKQLAPNYERIADGWIKLIPGRYRPFVQGLAEDVEYSMNRYFRGQSLIALCVGVLLAIGFKIIDFPLAVILGLFIGVLNLIPYMQAIGIIPMVLLALLKAAETGENFWIIFGLAVLVLCIVQVIQDLYLTPRIMGKAMGLNPAIILLSLSIWGTLLGFIGLIIALPLTTLFLSYYKRFILHEEEEYDIKSIPSTEKNIEKSKKK